MQRPVLRALHNLLLQYNPCVHQFPAAAHSDVSRISWSCVDDISGMQVGAMVVDPGEHRDIVVQRVDGTLMFNHDGHPLFHPLAYPFADYFWSIMYANRDSPNVDFFVLLQRRATVAEAASIRSTLEAAFADIANVGTVALTNLRAAFSVR